MKSTKQREFNIEDYDYYVREYIQKSEELDNPIKMIYCGKNHLTYLMADGI